MAKRHRYKQKKRGIYLISEDYRAVPLEKQGAALVRAFGEGPSIPVRKILLGKSTSAAFSNLRAMQRSGVEKKKIIAALKQHIKELRRIYEMESGALRSRLNYHILLFEEELRRIDPKAVRSKHLNFKQRIYAMSKERGKSAALSTEIGIFADHAARQAFFLYMEGQPSRAFSAPVEEAIAFLKGLRKMEFPGLTKSVQRKIDETLSFLEKRTSPVYVRERVEAIRRNRLKAMEQIGKANSLRELRRIEREVLEMGFDDKIDNATMHRLVKKLDEKREKISKAIVGKVKPVERERAKVKAPRFERRDGYVWIGGQWIPKYTLENFLRGKRGKRLFDALELFEPKKRGRRKKPSALGQRAVKEYKAARERYKEKYGVYPSPRVLLEFMEREGKPID